MSHVLWIFVNSPLPKQQPPSSTLIKFTRYVLACSKGKLGEDVLRISNFLDRFEQKRRSKGENLHSKRALLALEKENPHEGQSLH